MLIKIAREKCPYTRGIEQNHGGPLQGGLRVIFDPAGRSGAFVGQHLYFYDNGTLRQERPRLYPALSGFAESPTSISLVSSQTDEHDDLRSLQLPGKVEYLESYGQGATALFLAKVLQKLRNDGDDLSQLRTLVCPELPLELPRLIPVVPNNAAGTPQYIATGLPAELTPGLRALSPIAPRRRLSSACDVAC